MRKHRYARRRPRSQSAIDAAADRRLERYGLREAPPLRPLVAVEITVTNHETGEVHRLKLCAPNRRVACNKYALIADGVELGLSNKTAARDLVAGWMPRMMSARSLG